MTKQFGLPFLTPPHWLHFVDEHFERLSQFKPIIHETPKVHGITRSLRDTMLAFEGDPCLRDRNTGSINKDVAFLLGMWIFFCVFHDEIVKYFVKMQKFFWNDPKKSPKIKNPK